MVAGSTDSDRTDPFGELASVPPASPSKHASASDAMRPGPWKRGGNTVAISSLPSAMRCSGSGWRVVAKARVEGADVGQQVGKPLRTTEYKPAGVGCNGLVGGSAGYSQRAPRTGRATGSNCPVLHVLHVSRRKVQM